MAPGAARIQSPLDVSLNIRIPLIPGAGHDQPCATSVGSKGLLRLGVIEKKFNASLSDSFSCQVVITQPQSESGGITLTE